MDQDTLVKQIEGGRTLIAQLRGRGFEVKDAFWAKTDDSDQWYLYIVTPVVEELGPLEAYRQIHTAIGDYRWDDTREEIDPFSIRVLEPTHPFAKGVRDLVARHPDSAADTWYRTMWIGDTVVSGMYLYARTPAPQPAGS
jgi:hypothetical protein